MHIAANGRNQPAVAGACRTSSAPSAHIEYEHLFTNRYTAAGLTTETPSPLL
jgi:hypothetical protein